MTRNQETRSSLRIELLIAVVMVAFIVASRLVIDIPNFKPVMAVAMLGGFLFRRKTLGVLAIAGGMLASDCLIGFYDWRLSAVVYAALLLPMFAGGVLRRWEEYSPKFLAGVVGFAGLSAVLFYVSTTIAVWLCYPWYGFNAEGLFMAFAYGLPFFKWTLAGNVLFSVLLFGAVALFRGIGDVLKDGRMIPVKVRR